MQVVDKISFRKVGFTVNAITILKCSTGGLMGCCTKVLVKLSARSHLFLVLTQRVSDQFDKEDEKLLSF